jgi:hypothetical protein
MPYRNLTDQEKTEINKEMEFAKKRIEADRNYLADLETKLQQGQWYAEWKDGEIVNESTI